jgi:hypothetical protein
MAGRGTLTEEEWLRGTSPHGMLDHLQQHRRITKVAGGRRLRLFCVACCRSVWEHLDEQSRHAVAVGERYADGRALRAELAAANERAAEAYRSAGQTVLALLARAETTPVELVVQHGATDAAQWTTRARLDFAGHHAANSTANVRLAVAPEEVYGPQELEPRSKEHSLQAGLLRCIFGNPFRPVAVDRAWAAWNGCTVTRLARAIYDERAFDRLPILADALEDAGCADRVFLDHCRSAGPHARGCWVVDALLGSR